MTPTDQQVGELDRRLTRLEPLVRRRGGGGASYPSGGDPGEVLTYVGPGASDVAWSTPAGSGDKNYVHVQGTPASTWIVTHGLGKFPAVDVVDTGGSVVIPSVHFDDVNTVTLTFGSPTTGKAFVN
jgi:hypothetical protein